MKNTKIYKFFRKLEQDLRRIIKRYLQSRKLNKATPVFVFQMGKVASSSIHYSLKQQYPGAVGHAHHIGADNWASELLYDWFKSGNQIKIISPVRDPISRNISSFFQQYSDYTKKEFNKLNLSTEKMIDEFIEKYPHETPLTWFDDNIKKYFGIDVYETVFPESGIATYTLNNASLLVFRIDVDDSLKEKAIREFLDFESFKLRNKNISSNKEYYSMYKQFINSVKLPETYLSKMRESKYFNNFYRKDEIVKIIDRWK